MLMQLICEMISQIKKIYIFQLLFLYNLIYNNLIKIGYMQYDFEVT